MRFITIETEKSGNIIINPDNITSISKTVIQGDNGKWHRVMLSLGGYEVVYTKFTDVESAVDYIQRASSVSLGAPNLNGKHIPGGV